MNAFKIAIAALVVLSLVAGNASAFGFQASNANTMCANIIPATSEFAPGISSQQSMLAIAFLIMLIMLLVSAAAYALGRAFGIQPLLGFGKKEMKEVGVTALIVLVFAGTFSAVSAGAGLGSFFTNPTGTSTRNVFVQDCTILSSHAISAAGNWLVLSMYQVILTTIDSLRLYILPLDFGILIEPLKGLEILTSGTGMLGLLSTFTGALTVLLFAIPAVLGIFYLLLPLFFYAGIVLRTIPWTRAAGGAFLGLFIAFYFLFPFLLYFFISPYSQAVLIQNTPSLSGFNVISSSFSGSNPISIVTKVLDMISNYSVLNIFIVFVVEPVVFLLVSTIIALIISLDFMEALGSVLGSPALSSQHVLRGVI